MRCGYADGTTNCAFRSALMAVRFPTCSSGCSEYPLASSPVSLVRSGQNPFDATSSLIDISVVECQLSRGGITPRECFSPHTQASNHHQPDVSCLSTYRLATTMDEMQQLQLPSSSAFRCEISDNVTNSSANSQPISNRTRLSN